MDEAVVVMPNLAVAVVWPGALLSEPVEIERSLKGEMLKIWKDHAKFPWLQHLVVGKPDDWCHIIFKRGEFKGLPCANVIYMSDGHAFNRYSSCLSWHFFWQGMMSAHVERRMLAKMP
jgi:hypothetical protein